MHHGYSFVLNGYNLSILLVCFFHLAEYVWGRLVSDLCSNKHVKKAYEARLLECSCITYFTIIRQVFFQPTVQVLCYF
jgi:hypothetical protein